MYFMYRWHFPHLLNGLPAQRDSSLLPSTCVFAAMMLIKVVSIRISLPGFVLKPANTCMLIAPLQSTAASEISVGLEGIREAIPPCDNGDQLSVGPLPEPQGRSWHMTTSVVR